jgi:hypothetical protein
MFNKLPLDNMATEYTVRLKCPYGDRDQFLMLENREENLNQILETPWDFECPTHGVQREIPIRSQKSLWSRLRSQRNETKAVDRAVLQGSALLQSNKVDKERPKHDNRKVCKPRRPGDGATGYITEKILGVRS